MTQFAPPRTRIDPRLILASIAGLWLCYFALATARTSMLGWDHGADHFWRRGLVTLAGMAFTALVWWSLHLADRCATWAKICVALIMALLVSMAIAQVNFWAFRSIDEQMAQMEKTVAVKVRRDRGDDLLSDGPQADRVIEESEIVVGQPVHDKPPPATIRLPGLGPVELASWDYMSEVVFSRYFMILSWCALYFAMAAGARAKAAERREGEYRRAAAQAEVRSLRYQVNPHFLFNTLNSLSALVMTGRPERAEAMIQTLSTYYRRTLSSDPTGDVTLSDEIALQRLYLEIEAVRFPERLRTSIEIAEDVADALVPGMILQPVIENSVKYAIAAQHEPVTIAIRAAERDGRLVVTVSDDGPLTETGDPHGCGIGLGNVRDRLKARFGDQAKLRFGPREQGGFDTILTMPLLKSREG